MKLEKFNYIADESIRIDKFIASKLDGVTRSHIQKLIDETLKVKKELVKPEPVLEMHSEVSSCGIAYLLRKMHHRIHTRYFL